MNILKIIMAVLFGFSAAYIIWCLCGATRYIRKHPDEFNMANPAQYEDEHPDTDGSEDDIDDSAN